MTTWSTIGEGVILVNVGRAFLIFANFTSIPCSVKMDFKKKKKETVNKQEHKLNIKPFEKGNT